ncbi:MAG TPA: sugar phosphate nucleotidyltransferase [Planctomycetota bacterium]|jgi:mannose-1-phosphate guanylyltransferase
MNNTTPPRIFPVILAGGASSRLWPASDRERPKWDLRLFGGGQSLLEGAWSRGRALAQAADCFVVAGQPQAPLIRRSLTGLPPANLLIEPEPRDTAGAIAYAAGAILRKTRQENFPPEKAVMLVLPGDHVIQDVARFGQIAQTGAQAAVELSALVTLGILPRAPATCYGYIHRGAAVTLRDSNPKTPAVFNVIEFREKPDAPTAQEYVRGGQYYWNGGIFLWQLTTLLHEFSRQLPGHAALARELGAAEKPDEVLPRLFAPLKKISIDFGIMEHAAKVAVVAADFEWDDIGSWSAVAEHLEKTSGNAVGPGTRTVPLDATGNLVFAPGKRVALVGVEGLVVVASGDEILVCRMDRDQDVKKVSQIANSDKPAGR